jgi:Bacterial Ig-like domain
MSHANTLKSLAALLLAGAALVGCGGGDAEPPPPPVGNPPAGPDTTAPSVTISNDVSAPAAAGPVTFSFVFSEDVGVSFDGTDITVVGGSPGTFTRVDGRQATLVVTPPLNVAGTMTVSVAAGRFNDIAGNANAAGATASKDYIATQTITFASPGNQTIGTPPPALVATASSGLPVTITSTTASVCTVSGTTLTLVAAGTCSLTASQAGTATYGPAVPVIRSFAVTGGGAPADLVFSTGLASTTRTVEGGEVGGFSGSNVDGFNCSPPAACGGGGEFPSAVTAANSYFFYFYQTPTPATDLYMGVYLLAPGVVGPLSDAVDHAGVQINGQTSIKFKVGQNAEWFGTATNKYAVNLQLGKRYVAGGGACRIQLRTIVTPTAQAATEYTVPFSAFTVVQDCGQGLTVAQALAASPITQVTFQAGAGGPAQSAGGQTTGANLTVAANGVYPTTLVVVGGISFE